MRFAAFALVLLVVSATGRADILEWQDAAGVKHYTNLKEEVPAEHQADAQIVVNEVVRRPHVAEAAEAPAQPAVPEPRREAQVIYDRSREARAYVEGLERGIAAARGGSGGGGSVQITGPLAIANASAPATYPPCAVAYRHPLITTSFDRGRSRHLTLRMLLQDQFAIDREAPFVFEGRLSPPFGHIPPSVELNPFVPRGLPHGAPRRTRVVTR